jgi:hypothetical protein
MLAAGAGQTPKSACTHRLIGLPAKVSLERGSAQDRAHIGMGHPHGDSLIYAAAVLEFRNVLAASFFEER